jgi:hypothetical protein
MWSTHRADRVLGGFLRQLFPELARRTVARYFMRIHAVVILEPRVDWRSTLAASGFALTRA